MSRLYIAGAGMTKFGKSEKSLQGLLADAAQKALSDANLDDVDAIFIGVMNPEEFVCEGNVASLVAEEIGLSGKPAMRVETASSSGAAALHAAADSILSGHYESALVLAGEKMTHLPVPKVTKILAEVIERKERACGMTMPALAAMLTEAYRKRGGLTRAHMERALANVAIKNHHNGSLNEYAQFRREITEADYLASRYVAYPLRLYDCAPMTDGAAAIVLTSEEREVMISGLGQATDTQAVRHRGSLTSFAATRLAAIKAYKMADIGPDEVDFAEVHDAFTSFEIISTEDLGFFKRGKGAQAALKGFTSLDGPKPINPSGGLKARGHPVGASGLAQVVEVVWQLRGEAGGGRQLKKPAIGLAHSIGGLASNNFVTILELTERVRSGRSWLDATSLLPDGNGDGRSGEAALQSNWGIIETCTLLHAVPEGMPSPLPLAFVRDDKGILRPARGKSADKLKIGRRVFIEDKGDWCEFTTLGSFEKISDDLKRLLKHLRLLNLTRVLKKAA